jgi:hypothetical protein
VTTYPVPEGLTAVTVGLTRNQKSIEVIQFHGVAGNGSNIAGMENLLPDTARLHDHLWILFPLVPGETMKEIYVIHRRKDERFRTATTGGTSDPDVVDGNSLVVSRIASIPQTKNQLTELQIQTTHDRYCHFGPYIPSKYRTMPRRARYLRRIRASPLKDDLPGRITHLHLTEVMDGDVLAVNEGRPVERREAQGTGIYVALTLEGKHDAVRFDRDDNHDTDDDEKDNGVPDDTDFEDEDDSDDEDESGSVEEDITDSTTTVLSKIWDEADLASPRPFEYVATRDDLEIFSQADMGNIANFQIQTYTPNP